MNIIFIAKDFTSRLRILFLHENNKVFLSFIPLRKNMTLTEPNISYV